MLIAVHTRALLLAFSALDCRMSLTTVTHAIAHALNIYKYIYIYMCIYIYIIYKITD
jgi:hypothetical protein